MFRRIQRWTKLALGRTDAQTQADRRSQSVIQGTLSAVASRVIMVLVGVVSVPLTIGYLGSERYGVWVTIGTFLAFLSFTDFGLANSLTNALGKAYGEERRDIAARYVSSAFCVLWLISLALLAAGLVIVPHLPALFFPKVTQAVTRSELGPALMIAVIIFVLNFPLLITNKVLGAHQESALANIWATAANVANLGAILIVIWCHGGLPWLVLGSSGLGLLTNVACAVWVFGFRRPWLRPTRAAIDSAVVKDLFSSGWKFLVIGAAWMVNSETDNLVIAHYLGPAQVTPYSITFGLFATATLLQTLAYPSLWPAYSEAYARKDFAWILRTFRSNFKISFVLTITVVAFLIVFGRAIIRFWAGEAAVPSFSVLVWMGVWNLMLSHLYVASCLLNATGHLKGMTIYGTITAVLNLALSIALVKTYGIAGVIAGTVIAFAIANYIPTFIEVRGVLRRFSAQQRLADSPPLSATIS